MKTVIRSNVFETASSSVHTFVISKEMPTKTNYGTILANIKEYDWGHEVLDCPEDRLSYLMTTVLHMFSSSNVMNEEMCFYRKNENDEYETTYKTFAQQIEDFYVKKDEDHSTWFDRLINDGHTDSIGLSLVTQRIIDAVTSYSGGGVNIRWDGAWSTYLIDHGDECGEWLAWMLGDTDRIVRFVFGDSKVYIDNDNRPEYEDEINDIDKEKYDVFEKGN